MCVCLCVCVCVCVITIQKIKQQYRPAANAVCRAVVITNPEALGVSSAEMPEIEVHV